MRDLFGFEVRFLIDRISRMSATPSSNTAAPAPARYPLRWRGRYVSPYAHPLARYGDRHESYAPFLFALHGFHDFPSIYRRALTRLEGSRRLRAARDVSARGDFP